MEKRTVVSLDVFASFLSALRGVSTAASSAVRNCCFSCRSSYLQALKAKQPYDRM